MPNAYCLHRCLLPSPMPKPTKQKGEIMTNKNKKEFEFWKEKYLQNKSAYEAQRQLMDKRELLYKGTKTIYSSSGDEAEKSATHVRNIVFENRILNCNSHSELKKLRRDIQIIFQDPYSSLNPKITVGQAIGEPLKTYSIESDAKKRKALVLEMMEKVGLEASHYDRYPHEFSGGQRQRIGIARALILRPKIVICDESVSALDVSIQAQVLNLLADLKREFGLTYIFISHDLAVVKYVSDRMIVMRKGKVIQIDEADKVYSAPSDEYVKTLIDSIPS